MREIADPLALLDWYDQHARVLPWRVSPKERLQGVRPDPYRVWLSEVMLQQTTVVTVKAYFEHFTRTWPRVQDLAAARDAEVMAAWAGLGYYARARNLLKCARVVVADHGSAFPTERAVLQKLPGIGPYTSAAIAAIAFDQPETVVDGNVERVMARLFDVHTPLPAAKVELTALAATMTPGTRPGDYAQAVMDLGATICTPRAPACGICPWWAHCHARAMGSQAGLPRKSPKPGKPVRHGIAYLVQRGHDGAWLLEQRPDQGLLGGMLGWPGSNWTETVPVDCPPLAADWTEIPGEVRHTFTHFHLRLRVRAARIPPGLTPERGWFQDRGAFRPSDLPTVMRKAFNLAEPWFSQMDELSPPRAAMDTGAGSA